MSKLVIFIVVFAISYVSYVEALECYTCSNCAKIDHKKTAHITCDHTQHHCVTFTIKGRFC